MYLPSNVTVYSDVRFNYTQISWEGRSPEALTDEPLLVPRYLMYESENSTR